jgi:hypothetical protein
MISRLFSCALFACVVSLSAVGATPREIAPGLTLIRVHDLSEDIPDVTGTFILDLRYVRAAAGAAPETAPVLARLQQPGPLRVVLYDREPAADVAAVLQGRQANVVTVAPEGARPAPDVTVKVDAAADRAAYEALESGAELAVLADASVTKRRFDEAALVRARPRRGQSTPPPATPAAPTEPTAAEAATPEPTPVDVQLQHAVRLARGLQALGRG